jgi:hypothetical protein
MDALAHWQTFFFLVGSSGAGLTGLQFVVIALAVDSRRRATSREIEAFTTPTIIHFCAVLLVSAIMSLPWPRLSQLAYALGACGLAGLLYGVITIHRVRSQTTYRAVFEDWLWHAVLPMFAHTMLLIAAILLTGYPQPALFVVGGTALVLLFIGIHNAWDTVTYLAIEESTTKRNKKEH